MINRLILWVSLLGMVLAVHLWVQKARGFDQGCLGLETHAVATEENEGGCADAGLEAASHLFGVSNAAWGYAFYFGLALLSFGKIAVPATWARRMHGLGEIATVGAFVYSAYLLYFQAFVAGAFCVLCLTSIGLVTTLLCLQVALRVRGGFQPVADSARAVELGLGAGALFASMGLLVVVLVFVNRLGTRNLDDGNGALEMRRIVGRMLPAFIDSEHLRETKACHIDYMAPRIDLSAEIGPEVPFLGHPDGVPVVIFADPHCPHCRDFYPTFLKLVASHGDRARFYLIPRLLWDRSIPAVAALKLAESTDKYFELWNLEMSAPKRAWLTSDQLSAFYRQLDLDDATLAAQIEKTRPQVLAARKHLTSLGINGVPAIYIRDQKVFGLNFSADCLGKLIDNAVNGRDRPAAIDEVE